MGSPAGLRLSRRRHQRPPGGVARADDQPQFVQARHEEMAAFAASGTPSSAAGSASASPPAGRGDPSAERPVRREARPRPGGRDRRSDRPHRDGRLATSRRSTCQRCSRMSPATICRVSVPEQLPNAARPGHPHRPSAARADRVIIPADVQELAVPTARRTPSRWCRPASSSTRAAAVPDDAAIARAADLLNAGTKVAVLIGQGARGARRRGDARSPTCSAPASRKRCWARMCCPTSSRG